MKTKNFLRTHFPSNKQKFFVYFKHFVPVAIGSLLFALNGVVDNFMVGKIDQGVTALSAANQWSNIMISWFIATSSIGGVILSQFYHGNQLDYVKKISRYRLFLSLIFVFPLAIITWINPDLLISVFYKDGLNEHNNEMVYKHGKDYLELISIQWILMAFTFNLGNQFSEIGHGKYRMYFGIGTLSINIFLNSMLIYGAKMGVRGAAIATIGGRLLFLFLSIYIIWKNKFPLSINLFKIFETDRKIQKIYWRRWIFIFSMFTIGFFINFRNFFYARGYVPGSLGIGVSATSVLGLTGSLLNVFTIVFTAVASMTNIFVSSELGKGNYKQAKINADELKGFNTSASMLLALIMIIFASLIPYMSFLSSDQRDLQGKLTFSAADQLKHVRNSLFVLSAVYPIWIWFLTSYRNYNAGGQGNKFSIFNWFASAFQLGWLAIIMLVIVPSWPLIQNNFAAGYALFFIFDFVKLIGFEYFYYSSDKWLYSITKNELVIN